MMQPTARMSAKEGRPEKRETSTELVFVDLLRSSRIDS
jgi:hypothetical protein